MTKNETKSAPHVVCLEVVGLNTEVKSRWKMLATTIKRATNCYWRSWLVAHTQAGNVDRIQDYLSDLKAWHEAGAKGPRPRNEVDPLSPDVVKVITKETKRYSQINNRCIELVLHMQGLQMKRKSSKGSVLQWVRMLADDGEFPNSSSPQPIPFDKRNSGIIVPTSDGGDFQLRVRVDRIERSGQKPLSTLDVFRLGTRGKKGVRQREILWKVAQGSEYEFCGSRLVYRESKDKWFAHISYRIKKEAKPQLDSKQVAFLRPAKKRPWWLRIRSYHHYLGGKTGKYVAHVRRQLLTDRWDREEMYRYAGSASKGHGRSRAMGKIPLLKTRWKDFVKSSNQQLAHDVIAQCIEKGCGRLVFFRPVGLIAENRFLFTAGKVAGRQDNTGWDWGQVEKLLADKCGRVGIEFDTRRVGGQKSVVWN